MFEVIKNSMMAGVGLALKAVDEVEGIVKELQNKGKISEEDGKEFISDLRKRYEEAQSKMGSKIEKTSKELLQKVNVLTTDDLNGLKKEIRELKKANIAVTEELAELRKEIMGLRDKTS